LTRIWVRRPEPRVQFSPPFLPGLETIAEGDRAWAAPLLATAEALRAGEFRHHGHPVTMRDHVQWYPAGVSESWLEAHHALGVLLPIGIAGHLADGLDRRRVWYEIGAGIVGDWMAEVGPAAPHAWERPVLTQRVLHLVQFHEFFAAELREDERFRGTFLRSLYDQVQQLASDVEGVPGDPWLVASGRALVTAGRFFDDLEAREWLERGGAILWRQLQEQVNEDGGHAWRSPAWQAFVLEQYVHLIAMLRAHGEPVPPWARKRLKAACDFMLRVTRPDGTPARLGGRAPAATCTPAQVVGLAGTLLAEAGIAPPGDLDGLWPRLLLGRDGRRAHAALPRRRDRAESRALRRTGYYVLAGQDGDVMILDGGGAADGRSPFGYELSVGGLPLLVAAGGTEVGTGDLGGYFASPRAHNVLLNGQQSPGGPASAEAHWMLRSGMASFVGVAGPHRRLVLCLPGRFWLVCDQLTGPGVWTGQSLVHLHPETEVRSISRGRPTFHLMRSRAARGALAFAGSHGVRLVQGLLGSRPQGWYAEEGRPPVGAPTVSLTVGGPLPLVSGYVFVPRTESEVRLELEQDGFGLGILLRIGRNEYRVSAQQDEIELRSEIV
jgi:hypothetical protein